MSYRLHRRYILPARRIYVYAIKCDRCDRIVAVLRSPLPTPKAAIGWQRQYRKKWLHEQCRPVTT